MEDKVTILSWGGAGGGVLAAKKSSTASVRNKSQGPRADGL